MSNLNSVWDLEERLRAWLRGWLRRDPIKNLKRRGLVVGENFGPQQDVLIDSSHCWHIMIGDNVTLAPRVHILAHDASTKRHLGYTRIGKVRIGNRVFIGASSIIMPGVSIGDDVIVGAGSIVTKDVLPRTVVAGNPAKVICSLDEFLDRRRAEMQAGPVFGEEYQVENGPTIRMKEEMNERLGDGFGYIS